MKNCSETLYESTGFLKYGDDHRLVVKVDQGIANYYRSLIPKVMPVNGLRFGAHITVVRSGKERPVNLEHWGKYEGKRVQFLYCPYIHQGKIYFWLNCFCKELEDIRVELGMSVTSQWTLPPDGIEFEGFRRRFHCTIANMKDI